MVYLQFDLYWNLEQSRGRLLGREGALQAEKLPLRVSCVIVKELRKWSLHAWASPSAQLFGHLEVTRWIALCS
jgi:hypothetical protein